MSICSGTVGQAASWDKGSWQVRELTNGFGNEFSHELLEVAGGRLSGHDLHHLLPDLPDLAALGVGSLLDLHTVYCRISNSAAPDQTCAVRWH